MTVTAIPIDEVEALERRRRAERAAPESTDRKEPYFFLASSLQRDVPALGWLAEPLIPRGTVTILNGDGGTGKSLLALQLCCSTALSRDWLGLQLLTGVSLFISAEDDVAEIHRRLRRIVEAYGVSLSDLANLTLCSLAGQDALLATLDTRTGVLNDTPLLAAIDRQIAALKPVVVVLDTLADLFPGNENDRSQARQFIGKLRRLAIQHDTAVVLLAHPSLTGLNSGSGSSGSTAWSNSARSRLYLERVIQDGIEPNPDARRLTTKKSNFARTGGEIMMAWRDGLFIAEETQVTGLDRTLAANKAERVFLALLAQFGVEGRYVSANSGSTYAPAVFASHPSAEGVTKRGFKSAMDALFGQGKVRIEQHGTGARQRSHIAATTLRGGNIMVPE